MNTAAPAHQPDPAEVAHVRFCGAVCLAAGVCFALPGLALIMGTIVLPLLALAALTERNGGDVWPVITQIVLGWAGILGVARLLYLVCKSQSEPRRWLTLLGIACGITVVLNHAFQIWTHRAPGGFIVLLLLVYLPLASTLHTVYLARRILFAGPPAGTANA